MRINRKRQDLVSFQKIENIRKKLKMKAQDIALALGVTNSAYHLYRTEGHLPIFRFQSLVNALRLAIIEEQQNKLSLLDRIINSDSEDV